MASAILEIIIVSLATKAPSQETQDEVMDFRYPLSMSYKDGEVWMGDSKKE